MKKVTDLSRDQLTEANRQAWDEAADYHRDHAQYRALLEGFRVEGHSCLDEILTARLAAIGLDGKDVVQICCNNGREILSVKNLGAGRCLGIDQSEAFLVQAAELAAAGGIDCDFLCRNVYDLPDRLDGQFDLVLITIGVFGWMPDLDSFFAVVARLLGPRGRLVVYEDHPILNMFDDTSDEPTRAVFSYFDKGPWCESSSMDYFGGKTYDAPPNYWTCHSLSDILMGLLRKGFALEGFEEFRHSVGCWQVFENQKQQLPLSYLLQARKTAGG